MPVKIGGPVVLAVVHPNIGGWINGYITQKNINPWYQNLKKPTWTPPNWVFAPVWTTLYCTMGYSSYLVWRDGGGFKDAAIPLTIYGINLALNWSWTPIFFGAHNLKWSFYEIMALWGSTVAMGISFYTVNPISSYMNIPYLLWNTYATLLNYVIYRDNQSGVKAIENIKKE